MGVRAPGRAGPGRVGSLRDRGSGLCSSPQPPTAGRGAEGSKALTFEGDEAAAKQPRDCASAARVDSACATPPPRITPERAIGEGERTGNDRQQWPKVFPPLPGQWEKKG